MRVDDIDLNLLMLEGKFTIEVIKTRQRIVDSWQYVLSVSGGDLKLEKCSWTLQDYWWNEGQFI